MLQGPLSSDYPVYITHPHEDTSCVLAALRLKPDSHHNIAQHMLYRCVFAAVSELQVQGFQFMALGLVGCQTETQSTCPTRVPCEPLNQ